MIRFLCFVLFSCSTLVDAREVEQWQTAQVPGEQQFTGEAWYRAWLKPHDSFFSSHERDLFGESVVLNIRSLAGAHEAYVNGQKIGSGGKLPPDYQDGRGGNHRHKIPSGLLAPDQWNEVAIRVYHPGGTGGFSTEAPFVMNYFWECVFEGEWEFRRGGDDAFLAGAQEKKPPRAAFESFRQSSRVLGEADRLIHGEKLPPEESLAKMHAAEGLAVDLLLAEPLVAQPTHFSFDARGRLWVAQYRQYPYPAGVKMISRDRYYRSHYDRVPPPPPNHDRGRDVVSVHEDTDGDGRYDRHKVFQDGLNMANAALRGRGGVWVMHTPYLLFYPDRDFDDIPDGPPEVHLAGFGMEDTHSVANGLTWGMDGWLYGAQGSTTTCHVTRPGIDPENSPGVYFQGCMVWRYHPGTRRFEIFAEGGGNNFGLEVDSAGRLFTGNNGGQTRGWHYLQGGMHLMQGTTPEKFGPPRNPFAFGELPKMASEQPIPRFSHYLTFVESTAMPERYQNTFLSVEPLHNFVIASRRMPRGATFKTDDLEKVLTSEDFAFRPVYIGNAPDGSVLIADFYEHYIAHGQHYQSQIDPTTGRIFRLRGKDLPLEHDINLHAKSSEELLALLGHPNRWHRHTAVRLLAERIDDATTQKLQNLVHAGDDRGDDHQALAALWTLYQAGQFDQSTARAALAHPYPPVRYWAVRLLSDDIGFSHKRTDQGYVDSLGTLPGGPTRVEQPLFELLVALARTEPDAEVRSQLAASARRLPVDQALALVRVLLTRDEDISDPYVPLLCWWVLEYNFDRHREEVLELFEDADLRGQPLVVEHLLERVMRALALKGKRRDLQQCARLLQLAAGQPQVDALLAGFEKAYDGRKMTGLPTNLAEALVGSGRSSLALRVRLGDDDALKEAIELLGRPKANVDERAAIARVLGEIEAEAAMPTLLEIASPGNPVPVQQAAIGALTVFDVPETGEHLLGRAAELPAEVRPALFSLLLSRTPWTHQLLAALSSGQLDRELIPENVIDQLRRHPNASVAQEAAQQFGADRTLQAGEVRQRIDELRTILAEGTGDPYAGEQLFMKQCAACHKLFHKGGNVGPDLTPYQRGNLETLLTSVVNPSAEIREGYETTLLRTADGRILSGFVTDQDTQMITIRVSSGEDVRVRRDDIDEMMPAGRSLMPDGLLREMTDQQLRDFFAYLRISQPISR